MIPGDILAQIRHIEIRSAKLVNEVFAGQYSSVFKGRGMEFAEVREYVPGDDVRAIDWNVTARHGRPYVKKYVEERELTVIFMIDASASQRFGTRNKFKLELAAELASVLAFSALRNNDRAGMLMFTDRIEKVILPKKGRNHVLRIIRETLYAKPEGRATDLSLALRYLNEIWRRKAVVFLLSDFSDPSAEKALRVTARRHDLVALRLADPRESNIPAAGLMELEDPETGRTMLVDTSDRYVIGEFLRRRKELHEQQDMLFARAGIDHIDLSTDQPYVGPLLQFFRQRERRAARL